MKRIFTGVLLLVFYSCTEKPVVKPGFDFSQVQTVVVFPTSDFKYFPDSGTIINKSIVYHLMKIGIDVTEREAAPAIIKEAALTQTGITKNTIDVNLTSSDIILICTLTDFKDSEVVVIPVTTKNQGSTVTTVESVEEPVVSKDDSGEETVHYETTKTKTVTADKGSYIETEKIEYVPSKVGVNVQLLDANNGDVLWTNSYWYSSLSLSGAVDQCVYGALKPLKKLLE